MADLVVTQVIPDETEVVADAINIPNNEQAAAFNAHKNGTDYRHDSSNIDVEAITTDLTPDTAAADVETYIRRFAYGLHHAINPDAATWASAILGLAADENVHDVYTLVRSHSHADASTGGKLLQANTHQTPDTDLGTASLHHTIGTGQFQAAAGNHLHDSRYVLLTVIGAANGVAPLNASGLLADAYLSVNIARIVDLNALSASTTAALAGKSAIGHVHGAGGEAAITSTGIAALAVTTTIIADNAVTTVKIADGNVTNSKLATDAVTAVKLAALAVGTSHVQDGAVATIKIADNAITTVKILDANITTAKIAAGAVDDTKIVAGGLGTSSIKDAAITGAKIGAYTITRDKLQEGGIVPTTPLSLSVLVYGLRKWNTNGQAIEYLGETRDLSSHVPGPGLRRYVLLEVNSTGALFVKDGDPTGGTAVFPILDPDMDGLGFVYLEYGMGSITAANIYPWRGPKGGASGGGGGSAVGHVHGMNNEARVMEIGLDPGFPRPTGTPSFYILVSGMRYRASNGQSKFWAGGLVGPFNAPGTTQRIDAVYLDPATGLTVIVPGAVSATPVAPSFIGTQIEIAYVHNRAGQTYIGSSDDGINGWVEDARTLQDGSGGATTINSVPTGGTGVASFTAGIVVSTLGGGNALSSIAAPTGTVVGTTDAQTMTNKTFTQANNGVVGVIFAQVASTTVDLLQYKDSIGGIFGNISRYGTFGFGTQELTGLRRVLVAGTITGASAAQMQILGTVNSTANAQTSTGLTVSPTFGAGGFTGEVGIGVNIGVNRTGGDTGSFGSTITLQAAAGSFGTSNYAAIFIGTTQVSGNLIVTNGLNVTGAVATTGASASLQFADRANNANYTLLYRNGNLVQFYDNTFAGVLTFDATTGIASHGSYTSATIPSPFTNLSAAYRKEQFSGRVQLRGTVNGTASLTVLPATFWVPPAAVKPASVGGWMIPVYGTSTGWTWGFAYFDGTSFLLYATGATPLGAAVQMFLDGISYPTV
jgi:hypothetical protein